MFCHCGSRQASFWDAKAGVYSEIGSDTSVLFRVNKASVEVLSPLFDISFKKCWDQLGKIE